MHIFIKNIFGTLTSLDKINVLSNCIFHFRTQKSIYQVSDFREIQIQFIKDPSVIPEIRNHIERGAIVLG